MNQLSAGFFDYARERYSIHLRREGNQVKPWTDDPILQEYRFCNVFREDDVVTKWMRSKISYQAYGRELIQATLIARWFNRIATVERLLPPADCEPPYLTHNMLYLWDSDEVRKRLTGVSPLVTGAFMVKSPPKMSKLEGLIQCIEQGIPIVDRLQCHIHNSSRTPSLEFVHEWLMDIPYIGAFMAYEVVCDLRHTMLHMAPDIDTWASAGPGAFRGAGRIDGGRVDFYRRGNRADTQSVLETMQRLLAESKDARNWSAAWPRWEMREVEHTLCEFDKYERARLGEGTPKQCYDGAP